MAGKRRIDKKFTVTTLAVCGAIVVLAGGVYWWRKPKESPQRYLAMAEAKKAEHDLAGTYAAYARATELSPPSAEMRTQLAALARANAIAGTPMILAEKKHLEQALEVDPKYLPANKQLMEWWWRAGRQKASPEGMKKVRDYADAVLNADPKDAEAPALQHASWVQGWLSKVETQKDTVERETAELAKIVAMGPADKEAQSQAFHADLTVLLAQTYLTNAQDQNVAGNLEAAKEQLKACDEKLAATVAAFPDDLPLLYRATSIFNGLRRADPKVPAFAEHYKSTLKKARDLAKPDAPLYVEVNLEAARAAISDGDRAGAEAIYKSLMETRPGSQVVRLQYAELLASDPSTRDKAIELLSRPIDQGADPGAGVAPAMLELQTRFRLQTFKVDAAEAAAEPETKRRAANSAMPEVVRLTKDYDSEPVPLILRGRLELLQGHVVDAVKTLKVAQQKYEDAFSKRADRPPPEYYILLLRIAEAFTQQGLTGPAKEVLRTYIRANPTALRARAQLIQLLLREQAATEARAEFSEGEKIFQADKDNAESKKVWPLVQKTFENDGKATPATVAEQFKLLPEKTRTERVRKAVAAMQLRQFAEAARVLSDQFAEDPKDVEVASMFVQALQIDGRTDEAKKVMKTARQNNPDELRLITQEVTLNGGTPADTEKAIRAWLGGKDEFTREIGEYELLMVRQDRAAAVPHLKRAAQLKPDDAKVMSYLFDDALADKDFKRAELMLPALSAANVDQAKGNIERFKLAATRGDSAEALRVATQLTQDIPDFVFSWLALGQAQGMKGNWAAAYNAFVQATQRQPDNAAALRGAIEAASNLNRTDDVDRLIADAMDRRKGDPTFARMKDDRDLTSANPDLVLHKIEDKYKGQEKDATAQYEIGNAYSRAMGGRVRAGDVLKAREYGAKALDAYGRVQDNMAATATAEDQLRLMATIADVGGRAGDPSATEARLKQFLASAALAPRWESRMILAEYYRTLGRGDDAVRESLETLRLSGPAVPPRRAAAALLATFGKVDEAMSAIDGAAGSADDADLQRQKLEIAVNGRRFDLAEKLLRARLAKSPNDLGLQDLLSNILINTGRFADAKKQINQTLSTDRNDVPAIYYRGLIQLVSPDGDLNAAIQDFEMIRDSGKQITTDMRLKLVEAYDKAKRHDAAIHELESMLRADPSNKLTRLQYFNALVQDKSLGVALQVADDGLALPELSSDPDLLMGKARIKGLQSDGDAAIALARQAVASSRQNPEMVRNYLELLLAANRPKDLLGETEALVKPGNGVPIWLMTQRATAKKMLGDVPGSAQDFATALAAAAAAKNEEASIAVAVQMGQVLGPDRALKVALDKSAENVRWRLLASYLYQSQQRLVEALNVLEPDLAALDKLTVPEQAQVLTPAGLYLVTAGPQVNYERAVDVYQKLLKLNPNDLAALNNLAFLLSEKVKNPDYAQALKYSQHAYEIVRENGIVNPLIYDTHGWVLVLNKRADEGVDLLRQAVDRQDFMEGHFHLGVAFSQAGYVNEAKRELARAKALSEGPNADPTYKDKIDAAIAANEALIKAKGQPK